MRKAVGAYERLAPPSQIDRIPVRVKGEVILVPVTQIVSIVADGELLHLTTIRQDRFTIAYRLKDLEARLDPTKFIRLKSRHASPTWIRSPGWRSCPGGCTRSGCTTARSWMSVGSSRASCAAGSSSCRRSSPRPPAVERRIHPADPAPPSTVSRPRQPFVRSSRPFVGFG